jgi:hypothetical protein
MISASSLTKIDKTEDVLTVMEKEGTEGDVLTVMDSGVDVGAFALACAIDRL